MSPGDLIRLVIGNLNRMRARVALTAIGVMIGTAAVVLLISLGIGLQTSATGSIGSFGDLTTVTVYDPSAFGMADVGGGATRVRLDGDVLDQFRQIPSVVAVTPRVSLQGAAEIAYGRREFSAGVMGVDEDAVKDLGWDAAHGVIRLGRGQAVLGSSFLEEAAGRGQFDARGTTARRATPRPITPEEIQGRNISITLTRFDESGETVSRNERYRVVGILEEQSGQTDFSLILGLEQIEDLNAWLTGRRRDRRDPYGEVVVKVEDRSDVAAVQDAIRDIGFESISSQTILQGLNQLFLLIQGVLGGVGGVALLVAAFGIANTMTMAIYERTKEIGIMKALGATNRDVLQIFLAEAGAIGLIGGALGAAVGFAAGWLIDLLLRQLVFARQGPPPPEGYPHVVLTPLWLLAFALGFSGVIGLLSGVYPALRAASMKPLAALRAE